MSDNCTVPAFSLIKIKLPAVLEVVGHDVCLMVEI